MSKVIGKLLQVVRPPTGTTPELGTVEFALCGYGSNIPRSNTPMSQFALITQAVAVGADGTFTVTLAGNDKIDPPRTYYTYTVKDANGDIVQTTAYVFADGTDYDLDWATTPFDPSLGPPPLPVPIPIENLLMQVAYDPNAVFSGSTYPTWQIVLTGDCSPSFTNLADGNLYTIIVNQDGAGGHAFHWPVSVHNADPVTPDPNGVSIQTFVAIGGDLYPIGAGTWQ